MVGKFRAAPLFAAACAALSGCNQWSTRSPDAGIKDYPQDQPESAFLRQVNPSANSLTKFGQAYSDSPAKQDLARQFFERAIQADHKHAPAYVGLARVLLATGKVDEAVAAIKLGQRNIPNHPGLWNELAVARAAKKDWAAAAEAGEKAIAGSPHNALYAQNLAGMYCELGDLDRARELFARAYSPAEAEYLLAGFLHARGDVEQSMVRLRAALALDPTHQRAALMIGQLQPPRFDPQVAPASARRPEPPAQQASPVVAKPVPAEDW